MSDPVGGAWNMDLVWIVVLAAGLGMIGGAAKVIGVAPAERKWPAGLFVGAIASVAAFYVLAPETPLKIVSACLISGYMGPVLLDALEARFKVLVAEQKAERAIEVGRQALNVAETAARSATPPQPPTPPNPNLPPAQPPSPDLAAVDRLRSQLVAIESLRAR